MNTHLKSQFVPYDVALTLNKLGFIEPCLGAYTGISQQLLLGGTSKQFKESLRAPLWQQAFEWFREIHNIDGFVVYKPNVKKWDFITYDMSLNGQDYGKYYLQYYKEHPNRRFDDYDQARLECVNEMIHKITVTDNV